MTRISNITYDCLCEVLSVVTWRKETFERLVRGLLRDQPELLAQVSFSGTKREAANKIVNALMSNEQRYSGLALRIMDELVTMDRFPDLDRLAGKERIERQGDAERAIASLKASLEKESLAREEAETAHQNIDEYRKETQQKVSFKANLSQLKESYIALTMQQDHPQERGRALEKLLHDLFALFNLEPRMSYSSDIDQVDGSFRLDTDDYLIEAKWTRKPLGRDQADVFAQKIARRGKLAVGLLVSVNSFSEPLKTAYETSSPFITMDGSDLFYVLDSRCRLDEMLLAKKRHVNDTGSCYLPLTGWQQTADAPR